MNDQERVKLLARVLDCGLSGGEAGDGNTVGRAADVVQANVVAELNTAGIAAVLTADAQTQVGVGLAAVMGSHLNQLANADLVQMLERIALVNLVLALSKYSLLLALPLASS